MIYDSDSLQARSLFFALFLKLERKVVSLLPHSFDRQRTRRHDRRPLMNKAIQLQIPTIRVMQDLLPAKFIMEGKLSSFYFKLMMLR